MSIKLDIEYIELKNFLSYGNYVTRLDVANLGPVLILGEVASEGSKSSNGAGKSSLLTAFVWCLFGRTIINNNPGDRVVNWHNEKNCYVKIKTADGWEIIRTRCYDGHNELILRKNGDDQTKSTNQNAQKKLEELFGLDYDIFTSSVFCGQFGKSFLEMAPLKRKEAIERLLGLDKLNQYADYAKSQFKNIEIKQKDLDLSKDLFERDLNKHFENLKNGVSSKDDFEDKRKSRIDSILEEINDLKSELKEIKLPDLDVLTNQWDVVEAAKDKLTDYNFELVQNQTSLEGFNQEISKHNLALKKYSELGQDYVNVDILKEEWEKYNDISQKIFEISQKLTSIKSENVYIEKEIETLNNRIKHWEDCANTECRLCGQKIDETHTQSKSNHLIDQKNQLELKLTSNINLISKLLENQKNQAAIKPNMSLSEANRINNLRNKILDEIKETHQSIKLCEAEKKRLELKNQEIEQVVNLIELKLKEFMPSISIDDAKEIYASVNLIKERIESKNSQIKLIQSEDNPYVEMISVLDGVINSLQDKIKSNKDDTDKLNILFSHYKYIHRSYNDRRKIKKWLLSELIPFLNDRIHYYLNLLNVDIEVKFSTTLSAETDKWDYEFCSGGERKRIDLAIMFGLYDLYMSIYGQQCNIMVLDEVDSKLDHNGVESFADVINDICTNDERPRPSTIFVISHKEELESMFPSQILIKKKGTFSYIDQSVFD